MSKALADRVDVTLLALQGAHVERQFGLESFTRLVELLLSPQGSAMARFEFQQVEGLPAARLAVKATVQLRCQRCLQAFGCPVESHAQLAFVTGEGETGAEAEPVPEGWEAISVDPRRVVLAELVEDELLLSLPLVPRHADMTACGPAAQVLAEAEEEPREEAGTQRPFANLGKLLKH